MKTSLRLSRSISRILILVIVLAIPILLLPTRDLAFEARNTILKSTRLSPLPGLTVVTLIYDQTEEHEYIEHNCVMISSTRHRFIVYTDNMSVPYCSLCHCEHFVKRNCPCPEEGDTDNPCAKKNPCEKLFFVIDVLKKFKEVVLLDADLLILKKEFLDHLQDRSRAHDFLATYGHAGINEPRKYYRNFNSGLVFMRWLAELDYNILKQDLYKAGKWQDQGILSLFVQKYYRNWDILSWKWHCRALKRRDIDTPPSECYTLHDRTEGDEVLEKLNKTRLKVAEMET